MRGNLGLRVSVLGGFLVVAALTLGSTGKADASPQPALSVIATIPVGSNPLGVDINPNTKRVYVANHGSNTVSVIDGVQNSVINTVTVGDHPHRLAVNPVTDRVYVANWMGSTVSVLSGGGSVVDTISDGVPWPWGIGVNPSTNRIYATNHYGSDVNVIDGATNTFMTSLPAQSGPHDVVVNRETNHIYASNEFSDSVSVFDGATNLPLQTVSVGHLPYGEAVNSATNRIYVANYGSNSISVIDGATYGVLSVPVGVQPKRVAVNTNANRIYVANSGDNSVSIVDGATNQVVGNFAVGSAPDGMAVDSSTNRIYVTSADGTLWVMEDPGASVPLERAVVFIQGIDSQSRAGQSPTDCSSITPGFIQDGERQQAGWIADYLSDPSHVGGLSLQKDKNFFYFSYSGQYCLGNDGLQDFRRPIYQPRDTCDGVADASNRLQTMLGALIARNPGVKFDLVAHSMGGVVSAYWLAEHGDDQTAQGDMQSYIHSITTFDSPLRGLPQIIPGTVLKSFDTSCVDPVPTTSWEDMSCVYWGSANYCSPVIMEIAAIQPTVPFFTLDATTLEPHWSPVKLVQAVDSERTTLVDSDSAVHCAVKDDHSSVWASKTITGGPPMGCWAGFHWTDSLPAALLETPNNDAKGAFVACAVSSTPASQCLDEIGTSYEPPAALPGPAPAGNTELQVSSSPFAIGEDIVLNPFMPNEEENTIIGFASLILASPLQFDHEAGEPIAIVSSPAVGGIADLPDAHVGAAATKSSRSAPNTFALAGLATGSALLLAGGAWYTRKRWLH